MQIRKKGREIEREREREREREKGVETTTCRKGKERAIFC